MAELADALGSGPNVRKDVGVRIPASAHFIPETPNYLIYKQLDCAANHEKVFMLSTASMTPSSVRVILDNCHTGSLLNITFLTVKNKF